MATLDTIATRFARCVELFRDPGAKEAQKLEFRALLGLLKELPVTLTVVAGRLELNGVPCQAAALTGLIQRLDLHGVGTIALPQNPAPAPLFDVLRVLADQPGLEDFATRLGGSGAAGIRVTSAGEAPPPFPDAARPAMPTLGTEGILRGEAMRDIRSVHLSGVPMVTHDPPPPPAARALPGEQAAQSAEPHEPTFSPSYPQTPQTPSAAPVPPAAPPAARSAATPGARAASPQPPAGAVGVLAELAHNPAGANVGDLLATVIDQAEAALKRNRLEEVLRLVAGIARIEEGLPDGSGARRQYGIAVRRICTKPVVEAVARLVGAPKHRAEATLALRRAGADAVEVLLRMLVAAPGMSERRAVFDALTQMTEGMEQVVQMLDHPEWFVVRNVAELAGELGMEEAIPALSRQLDHADERVRKAVAMGLAKIGSRNAAEPLRRALRDKSPEVRMQVALGIGGRKSSALAMPLVVAMEEETDEAVQRELVLALGRIGSPDAVQASGLARRGGRSAAARRDPRGGRDAAGPLRRRG
jgi:hypothetical protein